MKTTRRPAHISMRSDMINSNLEMQIYPSVSTEPSNTEPSNVEQNPPANTAFYISSIDWPTYPMFRKSSISEASGTINDPSADTNPWKSSARPEACCRPRFLGPDPVLKWPAVSTAHSHPTTDLEAGLSAKETASKQSCSSCIIALQIILTVVFLMTKYTLSHIAVALVAWFFEVTNVDILTMVDAVCWIIDTICAIAAIVEFMHPETAEEGPIMPKSASESLVIAWDPHPFCFAMGGSVLLILAAAPAMAYVMLWHPLTWCFLVLLVLGWVFKSLESL